MVRTFYATIFQKKRLQEWVVGEVDKVVRTFYATIFQKKGVQEWVVGGVDKVVRTFYATIFPNPPIHKLVPPHICSRYAQTNVARPDPRWGSTRNKSQ